MRAGRMRDRLTLTLTLTPTRSLTLTTDFFTLALAQCGLTGHTLIINVFLTLIRSAIICLESVWCSDPVNHM